MTLDIEATVIAEKIVEDLNIHVVAVGTTTIHVTVISIAAGHEVVQWTHLGHSVQTSAVTMLTAVLAVQEIAAAGTVTVIDAVNGEAHLDTQEEAVRQVAVADRIVISKADMADTTALRERIRRLNPGAPVVESRMGAVEPSFVLDVGLFEPGKKIPDVAKWLAAEAYADADHGHGHDHHGHGHGHGHHGHHHGHGHHDHGHAHHGQDHHDPNRHDARIQAFCITMDKPLRWQGVGTWLEMLIATQGDNLLRIKGILNLEGQERPVAIHGVRHLMHPPALLAGWPEGDARTSRLVFITRDIPRAVIEDGLRAFETAAG